MGMIKFNGASSKDFGVEVETFPNYVAPQKEYEAIHIPGRNGDLLIDSGTYSNIEKRYKVNMVKEPPATEVSGPVANFKSNVSLPLSELKTNIDPVQDLNGYSKPWIGGAGKNKYCDIFSKYTQPNDYRVFPITLTQGQTYKFWASLKGSAVSGCVVGIVKDGTQYSNFVGFTIVITANGSIVEVPSFTVDETFTNPKLVVYASTETAFNSIFANYNVQLEVGSQATSWEPYENICPISGSTGVSVSRMGVNLFWHNDVTIGSASYVINNEDVHLLAGTYVIQWKFSGTTGAMSGRIDDVDGNAIATFGGTMLVGLNSRVITIPTGKMGVKFKLYSAAIGTYSDFEISIGSTTPEYIPYVGSKYQSYFSGLANGTYGFVDLGDLTWTKDTTTLSVTVFRANISDRKGGSTDLICTKYEALSGDRGLLVNNNNAIATWNTQASQNVAIRDDSLSSGDATAFKTAMSGVYLIYELGTATTPTITQSEIDTLIAAFNADLVTVIFDLNISSGLTFAQLFSSGVSDYSLNTTNKTVTFSHTSTTGTDKVLISGGFKANTVYTFEGYYTAAARNTSLRFFYTDGTNSYVDFTETSTKTKIKVSSTSGKTVDRIVLGYYSAGVVTLYYDESSIYEETLGNLVFGGSLNVTTGLLTITKIARVFDGSENFLTLASGRVFAYVFSVNVLGSFVQNSALCSHFHKGSTSWDNLAVGEYLIAGGIYGGVNPGMTLEDYRTYLQAQYNNSTPVTLVATLVTPTEIQLTAEEIKTFIGDNNIFSDSGDVDIKTNELATTYSGKMELIANWLNSASGYARLEDSYDPDYYRLAYFNQALDIDNLYNEAGQVTLSFICKPQKFYKSGEDPVVFTSAGRIQNRTQHTALPLLKVKTNNTDGTVSIGNSSFGISAGSGTDIIIDCELQNAYYGIENKNNYIVLNDGDFPRIEPGTQVVSFTGGVQSVEVIPRWWTV